MAALDLELIKGNEAGDRAVEMRKQARMQGKALRNGEHKWHGPGHHVKGGSGDGTEL